uniref:AlNc14C305G10441 protein n=1 Tax=Albugo laibachii Nc14 TaxID=890382 RepID=F0WVY0_9STRA|nr:AlNc14C305G10441 [Albugo laibachii Nc14]|eukprot:CCA25581.1 AlNc14C305G10441 [Albugo laibachii Nc14]
MAMEGQEQLQADVVGSRRMLKEFKTFMQEQGKQLEGLQMVRDHSTQTIEADTTGIKSHGAHEIEDSYRAHWGQDQLKVKIAMRSIEILNFVSTVTFVFFVSASDGWVRRVG